jgi:hypothetical protein
MLALPISVCAIILARDFENASNSRISLASCAGLMPSSNGMRQLMADGRPSLVLGWSCMIPASPHKQVSQEG